MEHTPPPFFKRGPAPLVRLFFFASLSLALLIIDARFRYADGMRSWFALAAYPIQRAATLPFEIGERVGAYFSTQARLVEENAELRAKALAYSRDAQRFDAAEAESGELRRVIGANERLAVRATPAEVIYAGRDPYAHRVFIDRGANHGVRPGSPVTGETGVIGQVTRVHPLLSEVTLLTNPDQAIPVQVTRNGLRTVAFGGGSSGMLELRYISDTAEIQNGDRLVTSGIDGTYPPGLPVATVVRIERNSEQAFARVVCRPAAGVDRGRYVLVLTHDHALPPLPVEAAPGKERRAETQRRVKGKDAAREAPKDTSKDAAQEREADAAR